MTINSFVKEIIPREIKGDSDLFLGMGFVGADGKATQGFGIDLLFFLMMAKKVGENIFNGKRTIFVMDDPYQEIIIPNIEEKISLLKEIIAFLNMDWEIIKSSEFGISELKNGSYEKLQGEITAKILSEGGFQIGWTYPGKPVSIKKDERYFAEQFGKYFPEHKNIGFVLGEFPGIIPKYIPGPPYLVKKPEYRVLLVDYNLEQKFFGMKRIKGGTSRKLFEFFKYAGINIAEENFSSNIEKFIVCMREIEKILGKSYEKAFPNLQNISG